MYLHSPGIKGASITTSIMVPVDRTARTSTLPFTAAVVEPLPIRCTFTSNLSPPAVRESFKVGGLL